MIYFDGCYIAKYYLAEPDSAMVQRKAVETGAIACALHGKLETASVLKEAVAMYQQRGFRSYTPEHLSPRCDAAYFLDLAHESA